jgi:hypothetical protein
MKSKEEIQSQQIIKQILDITQNETFHCIYMIGEFKAGGLGESCIRGTREQLYNLVRNNLEQSELFLEAVFEATKDYLEEQMSIHNN